MLFIFEFFAVVFVLMSIVMGIGLVVLAYFGLAPMPLWLGRYISQQSTVKVATAVITSCELSPVEVRIGEQEEYFKKISTGTWRSVFNVPLAALEAIISVTDGAKAGRAVFSDPSNFCVMREAA